MRLLSRHELGSLIIPPEGLCASLYMLTHRAGSQTQQDPIRLKNLLRQAEERFVQEGLPSTDAKELLKPAYTLFDDLMFWRHQGDGLALFIAPHYFRYHRLPIRFDELVVVSDRFHVKPLLQLFTGDGRFFILALSQSRVRLFEGTRFSVNEVALEGVPKNIAEVLRYDQFEKQLQFRTVAPTGGGGRAAIFHGHGDAEEHAKENIQRYFRKVNQGLHEILREERSPLVLASVDYLQAIYCQVNTHSHLMEEGITGNPDDLRPEQLHALGWSIVEPFFEASIDAGAAKYAKLAGTGLTSKEVHEIVPAAFHGRVELLLAAAGQRVWGRYDVENDNVHVTEHSQNGDEDLLDAATVHTILNGGTVYVVPPEKIPDRSPLAAVFRY